MSASGVISIGCGSTIGRSAAARTLNRSAIEKGERRSVVALGWIRGVSVNPHRADFRVWDRRVGLLVDLYSAFVTLRAGRSRRGFADQRNFSRQILGDLAGGRH